MYFTRKSMSEASEAIFREQRQIRKEKLLSNPGLIIGAVGFTIILLAATLYSDVQFGESECNDSYGTFPGTMCKIYIRNR